MGEAVTIPGLDLPLRWLAEPRAWSPGDRRLDLEAQARTDLFVDPGDGGRAPGAPALVGKPLGDVILRARVTVDFRSTFDAGVLLVWGDEDRWAKLCFERSPDGQPTVVSVVTRGRSDDANAFEVEGSTAWLRVARMESALAFHASLDGHQWRFVRHFSLEDAASTEIGFLAQSPTGNGCRVTFDEVELSAGRLADLRDGT